MCRDGNDGPWSSFTVQLGTPPQALRVLPSTSGSSIRAVPSQGCTTEDLSDCPNFRGGIFEPNSSSTWTEKGIYTLPLKAEEAWGLSGNGQFAFGDITLSYAGGGGPQLIAEDPVTTLTIGSTATSRDVININMPYGSFDLTASWPLTSNDPSRYFLLRRAANESQYLLGRAFLQAA